MPKAIDPNKCRIVIAGAGGGKTTNLVSEVLRLLPELKDKPEKNIAVITYTNAATEEIRKRLSKKIKIPSNIFIGTCHSFLIRYIIEPYAHLLGLLPTEKSYINQISLPYKPKNFFAKRNAERALVKKISKNGFIVFDKIFEIARDILTNDKINCLISKRLDSILIDEYQDVRLHLHDIISRVLEEGNTKFYCIGDPLQSIYNFTYNIGQIKSEKPKNYSFNDMPLMVFANDFAANTIKKQENYRSSPSIVNLINRYSKIINLSQIPQRKEYKEPIFFFQEADAELILKKFDSKATMLNFDDETPIMNRLLLSKEWRTLNNIAIKYSLKKLDNGLQRGTGLYSELKRCILGSLGKKLSDVLEIINEKEKKESEIKFRQFCFKCYKIFRSADAEINYGDFIVKLFNQEFSVSLKPDIKSNFNDTLNGLVPRKQIHDENSQTFYSTIHTAKGLEAISVLVFAKNNKELQKWLTFESVTDNNDDFRLGYVAFSRARQLLCFACLQSINAKSRRLLQDAGFTIE